MFSISQEIVRCRKSVDLFVNLLKWPAALSMLLVAPAAVQAFNRYYVIRNQLHAHNLIYFGIGVLGFAAARVVFIARRGAAETMEHEITHMLFAMATLHRVTGMDVRDEGGGSMTFAGKGNWLIVIAPYFFPLTAFLMMFFAALVSHIAGYTPDWVYIALGAALCYNLFSFAEQLHPRQTDLKKVGFIFAACFLPGANLLSFGTVFAFVERGLNGVLFFYKLIWYYATRDAANLF